MNSRSSMQEPKSNSIVDSKSKVIKENDMKISYISLAYSLIYTTIGCLALRMENNYLKHLGMFVSFVYYCYSTWDSVSFMIFHKLKTGRHVDMEKWMFLAHHVITLYTITFSYYLFFLNLETPFSFEISQLVEFIIVSIPHTNLEIDMLHQIFTLAIMSNIFLYIAYIQKKQPFLLEFFNRPILTIESLTYFYLRVIQGTILIVKYCDSTLFLYVPIFIVYLMSIWWSANLNVQVLQAYGLVNKSFNLKSYIFKTFGFKQNEKKLE